MKKGKIRRAFCLLVMMLFSGCSYYSSYSYFEPYFETKTTWPVYTSGTHSGLTLVGPVFPVFPIFPGKDRLEISVKSMSGKCPVLMSRDTIFNSRKKEDDFCLFYIVEPAEKTPYFLQWNEVTYSFKLQKIEASRYIPFPSI